MRVSKAAKWRLVRRSWIAFCSGWWLAGIVFGLAHFIEVLERPGTTVLESMGVALVAGGFLPGARPVFLAADVLDSTGLPVGFTGILIGSIVGLTVWITLPMVLHHDSHREPTNADLVLTGLPYFAAAAGLAYLYWAERARGHTTRMAATTTLVATATAYLIGAAVIFALGVVMLS